MPTVSYPLDTTGLAATNLVKGEMHSLTEVNAATYRIIIPTFSPFYLHNLKLSHVSLTGEVTPLDEGTDFYCTLPYMAAQRSTGQAVYGGLSIITTLVNGYLDLQYQTIGGSWCCDPAYVYQQLLEAVYNARTTWWDTLSNVQDIFPPTDHSLPVSQIDGITDLLAMMEKIRQAVLTNPTSIPASILSHVLVSGNPHGTSADDVGLGEVANYPLATDEEVNAKAAVDKYVTLRQILNLLR